MGPMVWWFVMGLRTQSFQTLPKALARFFLCPTILWQFGYVHGVQ